MDYMRASDVFGTAVGLAPLDLEMTSDEEAALLELVQKTMECPITETPPLCGPAMAKVFSILFLQAKLEDQRSLRDVDLRKHLLRRPDFLNSCVAFTFRHTKYMQLLRFRIRVSKCRCDRSLPFLEEIHASTTEDADVLAKTIHQGDLYGMAWNDVGVYLFRMVDAMLQGSSDAFKFSRIHERGSAKRRDRGFEQLVHFFQNKPQSVMQASCAWYKTLGLPVMLEVLMSFAVMHPQAFERAVDAVDPDLGKLATDRTLLLTNLAIENHGMPPASSPEWNYITHSKFLTLFGRLPEHVAHTFFGPSADYMYKKLSTFFDGYHTKERANAPVGSLPDCVLTMVAGTLFAMHNKFATEKKWGVLDPRVAKIVGSIVMDHGNTASAQFPYMTLYEFLHHLRRSTTCLNMRCENKNPQGLSLCSKCKVARYCSSACQRAAWQDASNPHKRVCKGWSVLSSNWPLAMSSFDQVMSGYAMGTAHASENGDILPGTGAGFDTPAASPLRYADEELGAKVAGKGIDAQKARHLYAISKIFSHVVA